jgi:hypothetical protein
MADTVGEADIRSIDIQKFVTGFADEDVILKKFCRNIKTSAREIRWQQKTSGFITPAKTSGITSNLIDNAPERARPVIANQSFTRNTSYVRKYFVESETISMEDIKDSQVDLRGTYARDLIRAVASRVDTRIYNVGTESLSPSTIQTEAAVADGWDDALTGDPIKDILTGIRKIRQYGYNIHAGQKGVLYINSIEHQNLMHFLISTKGSSIPATASKLLEAGAVMEILDLNVVVSENATTDYAWIFIPGVTMTWYQFAPLTATMINDPGIGLKIRVWEEGEATLDNPKSSHLITDTVV